MKMRTIAEPYKIKMIEPIKMTTREYRQAKILEAICSPIPGRAR